MDIFKKILSHLKPYFGNGEFQIIENLYEQSYRNSKSYRNIIKDLKEEGLINTEGGTLQRQRKFISTNLNNLTEGINYLRNAQGSYIPIHAKITFKGIEYLNNLNSTKPDSLKILFLSANTEESSKIRIDKEYKAITDELNNAINMEHIKLYTRLAVDLNTLINALIELSPHILHFSGHGNNDGIELEGESRPFFLKNESLEKLIDILSPDLECIVLNSCYSEGQALRLTEKINAVIGMGDTIEDEVAILFSKGFYKGVSKEFDYSKCYELGKQMINTFNYEESEIPILYLKNANISNS